MLNKRGKSISAANILILGVSYKSNIDDIRESPALDIIEKLLDLKATISYDDKFVLKTSMKGKLRKIKKVINVTNSEKTIAKYDAILLLTNHDYYDYENIKKYADLVIDTRGVFINNKSNIERG
jgi:UDP-N-acetyl-D-glucosamine dehydrogenase